MKVGTDAVMLGAWADLTGVTSVLDVGTGCGILALMAAQRSDAQITAIDVHAGAIRQAELNFANSPWYERLNAEASDFNHHMERAGINYDYIISNPPFFINSLKTPSFSRNLARHSDDSLPVELLIAGASRLLQQAGRFGIVFPALQAHSFISKASENGLILKRRIDVKPFPHSEANRVLLEFSFSSQPVESNELVIREHPGLYTLEYRNLTTDFYLNF